MNIRNGHQERVFVGGAQQISIKLAAKIEAEFKVLALYPSTLLHLLSHLCRRAKWC